MMVIVTRSWQAWRNLHLHLRIFDKRMEALSFILPAGHCLKRPFEFENSKFQFTPIQSVSTVDTSDEFLSLCSCGAVCERTDGVSSVPVQFMSSRHSSLLMAMA